VTATMVEPEASERVDYARYLRRGRLIIGLLLIVGALAGLGVALVSTKIYKASAELFVTIQAGSNAADLSEGSGFLTNEIDSYAAVVTTPTVVDPAVAQLGALPDLSTLESDVSATVASGLTLITITASSPDPQSTARFVNAVGRSFARLAPSLQGTGKQRIPIAVTTVESASVPSAPSSPRKSLDVALGALLGLLLGVVIAIGRGVIDTTIRTPEDLAAVTSLPILGLTPKARRVKRSPLAVVGDGDSPRAESYRRLAANLQFVDPDGLARTLLVTSATPGEGKSLTAMNLGLAFAEAGRNVVVVDLDFRRPSLAKYLGVDAVPGVGDVLTGAASLDDALRDLDVPPTSTEGKCRFLTAGTVPPNPAALISGDRLTEVLAELSTNFDHVVLDGSPLLAVADAVLLANEVDGVVLVVGAGTVRREAIEQSVEQLSTVRARVLGLSVNRLRSDAVRYLAYART
jgi:succinoglycan biosynthesis transport protein ExoP